MKFNITDLENELYEMANNIVNFDGGGGSQGKTGCTEKGTEYISFKLMFRPHELYLVNTKFRHFLEAYKALVVFSSKEQEEIKQASDVLSTKCTLHWRKQPCVEEHPTEPSLFKITTRLAIERE